MNKVINNFLLKHKKVISILFIIFVPVWLAVYGICYLYFTSENCHKTWPHDLEKKHCVFYGKIAFQILEANPIIGLWSRHTLLKYDLMPQKYVNQGYELLAFVDYVFTKHNIKYTIHDGTELGSIRHQGFIPWDDDFDLLLLDDNEKAKKALLKEIKVNKMEDRYVLVNDVIPKIRVKDGIVIDFFPNLKKCCNPKKEKCDGKNAKYRNWYGKDGCGITFYNEYYNSLNEIYPLKRCKFGPLNVLCKNNVSGEGMIFDRIYRGWRTTAYTGNHTFNKGRSKKIVAEKFSPTLPTDDAWKKWVELKNKIKK